MAESTQYNILHIASAIIYFKNKLFTTIDYIRVVCYVLHVSDL